MSDTQFGWFCVLFGSCARLSHMLETEKVYVLWVKGCLRWCIYLLCVLSCAVALCLSYAVLVAKRVI